MRTGPAQSVSKSKLKAVSLSRTVSSAMARGNKGAEKTASLSAWGFFSSEGDWEFCLEVDVFKQLGHQALRTAENYRFCRILTLGAFVKKLLEDSA